MFKKARVYIFAVFLLGSTVGHSSASFFTFEDMIDYWNPEATAWSETESPQTPKNSVRISQQKYRNRRQPLSYWHDINADVDFHAGDTVVEAWLELDFARDTDDSFQLTGSSPFDCREWAFIKFDESTLSRIGEVDNRKYTLGIDTDWLNDDGILDLSLTVMNLTGNAKAWLDHSRLYGIVETADDSARSAALSVSESSTMILLGVGLIGFSWFSRKKTERES